MASARRHTHVPSYTSISPEFGDVYTDVIMIADGLLGGRPLTLRCESCDAALRVTTHVELAPA